MRVDVRCSVPGRPPGRLAAVQRLRAVGRGWGVRAGVGVLAVFLLAGCGSSEPAASVDDRSAEQAEQAEPADPSAHDAEGADGADGATVSSELGEAAVEVFVAAQEACEAHAAATGNPQADPARFADVAPIEVIDDTSVLIGDGIGERFIVDLGASPPTIAGSDGPDAELARDLSFGCPPELFLGTVER